MVSPTTSRTLELFLEEDLSRGDVTTDAFIPRGLRAEAAVIAKESGVLAGMDEACMLAQLVGVDLVPLMKDGETVMKDSTVLEMKGEARSIINVERTLLNLLCHMSGIATLTRRAVDAARAVNPLVRVAATRKTLPGLRFLEKKAVSVGGGDPHRYDLGEMMIVKDNHIKVVGSVGEAARQAKASVSFASKVEVEVSCLADAVEAVQNGADIVMLDNMMPDDVKKVVQALESEGVRGRVILEASGGVTLENIGRYALSGVDVISMGMLTHSSKALDLNLKITRVLK